MAMIGSRTIKVKFGARNGEDCHDARPKSLVISNKLDRFTQTLLWLVSVALTGSACADPLACARAPSTTVVRTFLSWLKAKIHRPNHILQRQIVFLLSAFCKAMQTKREPLCRSMPCTHLFFLLEWSFWKAHLWQMKPNKLAPATI